MKTHMKYLIGLIASVLAFVIGVLIEGKVNVLTSDIVQAIGGVGVVVFTGLSVYFGFIKKS